MAIDFTPRWLDADLASFRDSVSRFVETEVLPDDEASRERGHVGHDIWRRAGELGFLCTDIPEAYGGAGGDFRHEAVHYDAQARRGLTGMNVSVHNIVAHYLLNHGTEEQKLRWLPRMVSGELVGAIALTEPGAGSDLQGIRCRAVKRGDGWVLSGSKTFISNGYLAGLVVVMARTSPEADSKGFSLFIVETADAPGYRVGRRLDKIGLKAQDTAELFFDDVPLASDRLLGGEEGRGLKQVMSDLSYERTIIGVLASGAMEGAYEATLAHVRERKAFGKSVAEFQNTKFKMAEMATQILVARTFLDRCIDDLVAGRLDTTTASMIKWWSSDLQGKVIDECLQLFGGYGFMNEYLVARMYTDARIQRIYGGTNEIMKEIISRAL